MKPLMTAKDISIEIFNGNRCERQIAERDCKELPGYPKTVHPTGKKYWRRSEIYEFYGIKELQNAA